MGAPDCRHDSSNRMTSATGYMTTVRLTRFHPKGPLPWARHFFNVSVLMPSRRATAQLCIHAASKNGEMYVLAKLLYL